jgi:hypothetical protein
VWVAQAPMYISNETDMYYSANLFRYEKAVAEFQFRAMINLSFAVQSVFTIGMLQNQRIRYVVTWNAFIFVVLLWCYVYEYYKAHLM